MTVRDWLESFGWPHSWRHARGGADEIPGLVSLVPLSGSPTSDPYTPGEGDLLVGSDSPEGFGLLDFTPGAANVRNVLGGDNGDTTPAWKAALDSTNPEPNGTAAPGTSLIFSHRDHVHAAAASGGRSYIDFGSVAEAFNP